MVGPYVVQTDTVVTWGGMQRFVHAASVVALEPGSALWDAYGGSSNLKPLPPGQHDATADHSTIGD